MDYGDSVQKVLLRKIRKAEQDLVQLKLDYCRFVFGLTHRARVVSAGVTYVVSSVDVESMANTDDGEFTRPVITGLPADQAGSNAVVLGTDWTLEKTATAIK
ncbi:hypothetical protein D777_01036 [Marinobacter nitratireducens]|uniref:Uncharacterized protein n=1 Tax=Marinobacter nitratireducens TaxID=1137280 RepID=A0A072N545_9GAMM|nr:hypothetical protein [Marinobacter nitratireducens]KEF32402.1 hypothetical protein D777_01036 [Marinobacter nitratireducens]